MKCPNCSSGLLQAKSKHLIVDVCPSCKGIWFDDGELSQCVNALTVSDEIKAHKPKLFQKRQVSALHKIKEKIRFCPRCETALKKFNYAYDSNVIVDKCNQCGGVWTDRREVKQIAQHIKADPKTTAIGNAIAEDVKSRFDMEHGKDEEELEDIHDLPKTNHRHSG